LSDTDGPAEPAGYQAWALPQCGQSTEVETVASKTYPHWHVYTAWSCGGPPSWIRGTSACTAGPAPASRCIIACSRRPPRQGRWTPASRLF